jgi:hypothetical protein
MRGRARMVLAGRNLAIPHPPPVSPQVHLHQRLRFTCQTTPSVNQAITNLSLLGAIYVASDAVTGWKLFSAVRLRKVEVWAAPVQGGAPAAVRVQFDEAGTAEPSGSTKVHSDTSMGIEPAHVVCSPDPKSACAFWQGSSGATMFLLTCPVGAVIDLVVDYKRDQTVAPLQVNNALVGATVGQLYYRGLDGLALAGTTLPADAPLTG